MIVLRKPLRPPPLGWTMLIGLLQTTLFVGLVITALHDAGAGKVSVLTYTMPFWLLLLAWIFLGERLRGVQWLAVVLAFAGLVLVVRPWALDGVVSGVLTARRRVRLGRERAGRQAHAAQAHGGRPLPDDVADGVRLHPAHHPRGAHLQRRARLDRRVRLGTRLHGRAGQRRRLVPLAVRAARAAGRRRGAGDAVDPGRRRDRRVDPAGGGADARRGHRHDPHHRRARGARGPRAAGRPSRHGQRPATSRTCARSPTRESPPHARSRTAPGRAMLAA